jgi:hypothetical protein
MSNTDSNKLKRLLNISELTDDTDKHHVKVKMQRDVFIILFTFMILMSVYNYFTGDKFGLLDYFVIWISGCSLGMGILLMGSVKGLTLYADYVDREKLVTDIQLIKEQNK